MNYPSDYSSHSSNRMAESLQNLKYGVIIQLKGGTDNNDSFVETIKQAIKLNIDDYFYFDYDPVLRWVLLRLLNQNN